MTMNMCISPQSEPTFRLALLTAALLRNQLRSKTNQDTYAIWILALLHGEGIRIGEKLADSRKIEKQ